MTCYALFASDEPERIRYVGATKQPLRIRLMWHMSTRYPRNRREWVEALQARGAYLEIKALSRHNTLEELAAAEEHWFNLLLVQGHPLIGKFRKYALNTYNLRRYLDPRALAETDPHPGLTIQRERQDATALGISTGTLLMRRVIANRKTTKA